MPKRKQSKISNVLIRFFSVKWSEKYDKQFTSIWNTFPEYLKNVLVFCAVFVLGVSINGDWISIWVHLSRQFGYTKVPTNDYAGATWSLEAMGLKDFWSYFIGSSIVSFSLFYGIGGFLHWYYYVRRRDQSEEWKCQPKKFMSPELERHEIIFGSCSLFLNASMSAVVACFISNGGYSTVYYSLSEYGWSWFFLQFAVIFIYQDYTTYWMHRIFHHPWLYINFHKAHHKYKYPTAFSVTAIHPVESLFIQVVLMLPLFLCPVHWFAFYVVAIYTYIHGILQHSGINFKACWWQPWQPDSMFHDNHHQYFHVNFGFNIYLWDKLHGTYRMKDRVYNEDIFYGKGKSFKEASREEIEVDVKERNSENPLAYRNNKPEYQLESREAKEICLRNI